MSQHDTEEEHLRQEVITHTTVTKLQLFLQLGQRICSMHAYRTEHMRYLLRHTADHVIITQLI